MSFLGTAAALLTAVTMLSAPGPLGAGGASSRPAAGPGTSSAPLSGGSGSAGSAVAAGSRWVWPLDPTPEVVAPFDPPPSPWLPGHRGVDLLAAVAAPVRSPSDGRIAFAGTVAGREVLVVEHGGGLRSTLEPVASELAPGTRVVAGEAIGVLTGAAGHCAPAVCLHWGVLRADDYLDPLAFLRREPVRLLPLG